jgi:hypothetical protein
MSWQEGDTPPEGFAATERPPTKVCPKCSVQEHTSGSFCPHCGAPYERRRRRLSKRAKVITAAVLAVLLLGGAAAGVVLKIRHDDQVERDNAEARARERAEQQRLSAEQEAEAEAAAVEAESEKLQVDLREDLVKDLEKSVTKDAQKRVTEGVLDGPILRTECAPAAGESIEDLSVDTAAYECLALTEETGSGSGRGYDFSATLNFENFSYTWELDI